MVLEGRVMNGMVVLEKGSHLPEGTRVLLQVIEEDENVNDVDDEAYEAMILPDPSLPPDHPLAPYNREVEIAILRERIEATKARRHGIPLEEARARLAAEFGLSDANPG